jgi:hypothetical protein
MNFYTAALSCRGQQTHLEGLPWTPAWPVVEAPAPRRRLHNSGINHKWVARGFSGSRGTSVAARWATGGILSGILLVGVTSGPRSHRALCGAGIGGLTVRRSPERPPSGQLVSGTGGQTAMAMPLSTTNSRRGRCLAQRMPANILDSGNRCRSRRGHGKSCGVAEPVRSAILPQAADCVRRPWSVCDRHGHQWLVGDRAALAQTVADTSAVAVWRASWFRTPRTDGRVRCSSGGRAARSLLSKASFGG